jgi:chromosome segregation ATPase
MCSSMAPPNAPQPNTKALSPLQQAATTLETELQQLESICRAIRKIPLNSEKNIVRAAKGLQEALALPDRLAAGLSALATAMATMQARQQAALEPLTAFATEIQGRHQRLSDHMQAYAALGAAAAEVTARIQSQEGERGSMLLDVDAQLTKIGGDARALFDAAHADDFPELAREADALKQRAAALRKRLETSDTRRH